MNPGKGEIIFGAAVGWGVAITMAIFGPAEMWPLIAATAFGGALATDALILPGRKISRRIAVSALVAAGMTAMDWGFFKVGPEGHSAISMIALGLGLIAIIGGVGFGWAWPKFQRLFDETSAHPG